MKYIEYLNHLKQNNIILFDHDYRISFNYIKNYYNINNLVGGGINNNNNKLFRLNKNELEQIINISLSQNPHYLIHFNHNYFK
jgi:hypothetical protein